MRLLDPKLDIVFKLLLVRNPELIRAQLEAILGEPSAFPARERALHNWGRFFAARDESELAELAREDQTMATAVKALEELSEDPEARWMARDREDSAHFYRMGLERSRREGRAEGIIEGRAEGVIDGRAKGRAENQRNTILALSAAFGIQLTEAQRSALDDPSTDLDEIQSVLIRDRRWP